MKQINSLLFFTCLMIVFFSTSMTKTYLRKNKNYKEVEAANPIPQDLQNDTITEYFEPELEDSHDVQENDDNLDAEIFEQDVKPENESSIGMIADNGFLKLDPSICAEIESLDSLTQSIRKSIMDLAVSFKIHADKYNLISSGKKKTKKRASIQMQIVSAYLDEVNTVTELIKNIKSNFYDFKKNGCEVFSKLKSILVSDKIVKKLVTSIKKHVKKIELPFLDVLKDLKDRRNKNQLKNNIRGSKLE